MTFRKMLVLAAILAGLALYITKVELANDEVKRLAEQPFERLVSQSVSEISIAGEKGTFSLVNQAPKADATPAADPSLTDDEAARWKVQGVNDSGLERGALNTLLSSLRGLKLENGLSAEDTDKDLGIYGLSKPEVTVGVKAPGFDRAVQIGKLNEYVNKRYVKEASGSTVFTATNELYSAAAKSAADFRDHSPVALKSGSVGKLTISSGQSKVVLEQNDGIWKLVTPGPYTASDFMANNLIRELSNTKATAFIDDAAGKEADYGLAAPAFTVVAEPKSGDSSKPVTVNFGTVNSTKDNKEIVKFYMQVIGRTPIYELGGDPSTRFLKNVKELREKQLFKIPTGRVEEVRITVPDREEVVLTKAAGGEWTVNGKGADAPFVLEFLNSLTELTASDFPQVPLTELGFDAPTGKVTCKLSGAAEKDPAEVKTVIFGKQVSEPSQGFAALVDGTAEPFIVTADTVRKVTPRAEALLKSEPAPEPTQPAEETPSNPAGTPAAK